MIIKEADIKYIDSIAKVHVDSWKSSYKDNTACDFYEHIGGKREKEVIENIGGKDIKEVSFVFIL